jgi:hypothetical protein
MILHKNSQPVVPRQAMPGQYKSRTKAGCSTQKTLKETKKQVPAGIDSRVQKLEIAMSALKSSSQEGIRKFLNVRLSRRMR